MLLHTIGGVYIASANRHLGKGSLAKHAKGTGAYWKQKRHTYGTYLTSAQSMLKMYQARCSSLVTSPPRHLGPEHAQDAPGAQEPPNPNPNPNPNP